MTISFITLPDKPATATERAVVLLLLTWTIIVVWLGARWWPPWIDYATLESLQGARLAWMKDIVLMWLTIPAAVLAVRWVMEVLPTSPRAMQLAPQGESPPAWNTFEANGKDFDQFLAAHDEWLRSELRVEAAARDKGRRRLLIGTLLVVAMALVLNALVPRYELRNGAGAELLRVDKWTGSIEFLRTRSGQWIPAERRRIAR